MFSVILCLGLLHSPASSITSPYGWRYRQSLEGLWDFKLSPKNDLEKGFREKWWTSKFSGDILDMPVPSSFNDIGVDRNVRDYLGWVWYQTKEEINLCHWKKYRRVIHFGGVHYFSIVYFGDKWIGSHEGGHIPFEFDLPNDCSGLVTVAINNTLTNHTIPQGFVEHHAGKMSVPPYVTYRHDFDYFDYAGINRNVFIYATSTDIFIKGIQYVTTMDFKKNTATIDFKIEVGYELSFRHEPQDCNLKIFNESFEIHANSCDGQVQIENPILWWNAHAEDKPTAYLYSLKVSVNSSNSDEANSYNTQLGIRDIQWDNKTLLLNGKPIYLRGFGKHEDSDIRGRGFDWATTLRDFELIDWTGANVVRTSHYPPSIEFVEMANKRGILLIVESPACSLSNFDDQILARHKKIMREIFKAYGANPSVIMWSLANEPQSNREEAGPYFFELVKLMKSLDGKRPVTYVTSVQPSTDKGVEHVDVICFNRYNGWYTYSGDLDHIDAIVGEVFTWKKFNKPLIITEYGAGSVTGLHNLPSSMWSEDYQTELLKIHFQVFDHLKCAYLAGELVWVFADFATPQEYIRPGGCVKGIFTRQRQPKKAAYTIKFRYENIHECEKISVDFVEQ